MYTKPLRAKFGSAARPSSPSSPSSPVAYLWLTGIVPSFFTLFVAGDQSSTSPWRWMNRMRSPGSTASSTGSARLSASTTLVNRFSSGFARP